MNVTRTRCLFALVAPVVLCTSFPGGPRAAGDETDDLIARILRTTRSRPEAAKKVLESARLLSDAPQAQTRLAEKAYEFGMSSPLGYATALAALDLLAKTAPQKAQTWREKRIGVYRQQYLRGPRADRLANGCTYVDALVALAEGCGKTGHWSEAGKHYRQAHTVAKAIALPDQASILESLRTAEMRAAVARRVSALKASLGKDPGDTASRRRLVETYLIDMDRPDRAAEYVKASLGARLYTHVVLAAKEAAELSDADFLALGQWYRGLADKTSVAAVKARMLRRAAQNLRMFLEVYPKKDMQRLRVMGLLKDVEAALARIARKPTAGDPQWVDLLATVDPARHTVVGTIARKNGEVICADARCALASVPVTAVGSYDLQLAFTLKAGYQSTVILPVGAAQAALVLRGSRGSECGLEMVGGQTLRSGNPTAVKGQGGQPLIRPGARTTVDVAVRITGRRAEVTVTLNGKKLLAWSGQQTALGLPEYWPLPVKTFGLGAYRGTVQWHAARLRRLDADDRVLKWVSRDATYKVSSTYSPSQPPQAIFLTGEGKLDAGGMAFRTGAGSLTPWAVVTLKRTEQVKRIILDNCRGAYAKYNMGLIVEISPDGRTWTQVWRGTDVRPSWIIELKAPMRTRHIRISRKAKSSDSIYSKRLALAGIRVYAMPR